MITRTTAGGCFLCAMRPAAPALGPLQTCRLQAGSCVSSAAGTSLQLDHLEAARTVVTPPESQNHRMVGVGRDLCGSSSPTPLPKQGHLQQAAQDIVQAGLEYLQRRRLHNLPGQPVPVLCHRQKEDVLPHVQTELPALQFVPIAPCLVAGHH